MVKQKVDLDLGASINALGTPTKSLSRSISKRHLLMELPNPLVYNWGALKKFSSSNSISNDSRLIGDMKLSHGVAHSTKENIHSSLFESDISDDAENCNASISCYESFDREIIVQDSNACGLDDFFKMAWFPHSTRLKIP